MTKDIEPILLISAGCILIAVILSFISKQFYIAFVLITSLFGMLLNIYSMKEQQLSKVFKLLTFIGIVGSVSLIVFAIVVHKTLFSILITVPSLISMLLMMYSIEKLFRIKNNAVSK